jgi:hypothetical protein
MPFAPTDIAGLQLWFRSDSITGLSDGAAVATWSDESGNGKHATQATAAKRPVWKRNILNRRPAVRFDRAASQFLSTTLSQNGIAAATICSVHRSTDATNRQGIAGGGGSNGLFVEEWNGSAGLSAVNVRRTYTNSAATAAFYTWEYDGAAPAMYAWKNGTSKTLTGAGVIPASIVNGTWLLGATADSSNGLSGDLYEVCVWHAVISNADRLLMEDYFTTRWFVPPTLDCETLTDAKIDTAIYNGTSLTTRLKTYLDTLYGVTSTDATTIVRRYVNDVYGGDQ